MNDTFSICNNTGFTTAFNTSRVIPSVSTIYRLNPGDTVKVVFDSSTNGRVFASLPGAFSFSAARFPFL
ncbi:hypothetical protein [Bacillus toyonensis]|uniref:hypothetical protein n=1 Tax=Bacillus toyonensis TaxID=155322 RepID=UPI00159B8681|nr:hypothetical protein [Bacillus toyonensis]